MSKKPILCLALISALYSVSINANTLITTDAQYLAAINTVKAAATRCNTLPIQESDEAYSCYESQRTIIKKLVEKFDAANKALGIIDYSKPFMNKSYTACEQTYPTELRTFFKAQISQCKLGADVTLGMYAINSIANS